MVLHSVWYTAEFSNKECQNSSADSSSLSTSAWQCALSLPCLHPLCCGTKCGNKCVNRDFAYDLFNSGVNQFCQDIVDMICPCPSWCIKLLLYFKACWVFCTPFLLLVSTAFVGNWVFGGNDRHCMFVQYCGITLVLSIGCCCFSGSFGKKVYILIV